MRILVFGAAGMLGHKLIQVLGREADVWGSLRGDAGPFLRFGILDRSRCLPNIHAEDETAIRTALETVRPNVVINAVGIVKQLPVSKDVIPTLMVNSIFPHRLSQLADEFGFRLFTISTDCVFDGRKGNYRETDQPDAVDLYGRSKNLGEVISDRALTIRTSIIGRELATSHSLVEWFLSNEGRSVRGFTKAIYSGFPTIVLADIIKNLIFGFPDLSGLYHVSSDPISKYELFGLLMKYFRSKIEIVASDDLVIDRSLDSSMFRTATGFEPDSWDKMIEGMASDPTPYDKWK